MASSLSSDASGVSQDVGAALEDNDCCELTSLPDLIESLTIDATTGSEGVEKAVRSLLSSLYRACENDNLLLFQTIVSCMDCTDICPELETELLRVSVLNGSFRCSRHLVKEAQQVNLCSLMSWMCVREWDDETFQTLTDRGFTMTDCACKGMGALKHCIINGNEYLVQKCLENGCSPNAVQIELPPDDEHTPEVAVDEFSPLMCAILYANADVVEKLINYGADISAPEKCGMSALEATVYAAKPHETKLIIAAYRKAVEKNPEIRDVFTSDLQKSFINSVSMSFSGSLIDCMEILLESGANVDKTDKDGRLPLLVAVNEHRSKTVAFLLQCGCNVNAVGNISLPGNATEVRQVSPLYLAASQSNTSILEVILKAGAIVQRNENCTEEIRKRILYCYRRFTLKDWCRLLIRQQSRHLPLEALVQDWEIPATLKQFLKMEN